MLGCPLDGLPFKTFNFRNDKKTNIVEFKVNSICSCKWLFWETFFGDCKVMQHIKGVKKKSKNRFTLMDLQWIYGCVFLRAEDFWIVCIFFFFHYQLENINAISRWPISCRETLRWQVSLLEVRGYLESKYSKNFSTCGWGLSLHLAACVFLKKLFFFSWILW